MTDHAPHTDLDPADSYPSPGRTPLGERGPWWQEFREDLGRYRAHHGGSALKAVLLEQGLWALFQYRWSSGLRRSSLPAPLRLLLSPMAILAQKWVEIVTGISLPAGAQIYPGQYIGHFGPVIVHEDAVLHAGCNISQGVTIGVSGRGARRGCPEVGPRAYLGANAVVAGRVRVGADAVVGANSLVVRDVPDLGTAVGVPATVAQRGGTAGMGLHQHPAPGRPGPAASPTHPVPAH